MYLALLGRIQLLDSGNGTQARLNNSQNQYGSITFSNGVTVKGDLTYSDKSIQEEITNTCNYSPGLIRSQ